MSLDINIVKKVAQLSRLNLTVSELEKFQKQLSTVLEYIDEIDKLDTSDIEPTLNISGTLNRTRADLIEPSLTVEQALQNAPTHSQNSFVVPYVFSSVKDNT